MQKEIDANARSRSGRGEGDIDQFSV